MSEKARVGKTAVLCFSPSEGGMEHDAAFMAQKIRQHLGDCLLVVRQGTWLERFARDNAIPCEAIDFRGNFSLKAIRALRRLWRREAIRNVIFLGSSEMRSIHFSLVAPVARFIVRHGTTKSASKQDLVHRLTWSRVTTHWCISEHLRRNVEALFPVGRAAMFVNPVGLGDKLRYLPPAKWLTPEDDSLRLVHVGRLVPGKGQRDALTVIARLNARGVPATLTLYGEGPDRAELEARIDRLCLAKVVSLAGHVPHPYQHFGDFHGMLYPSYGEGFGNAFVEGLATGMHGFSYDNTVFPELRSLGLDFHMLADRQTEALVDAIEAVWRERLPLPTHNISLCRELFSVEREMAVLADYLV
ncbi:glycosyltransferase [Halomonas sp.]|uniref:glycosyltransferase n=1 Tax=Halomonas sp. TaxID=1486246 RepID=UPI003D13A05D